MRGLFTATVSVLLTLLLGEAIMHAVHPFDRMQSWIGMHERGFVQNKPSIRALHELDGVPLHYRFDDIGFRVADSLPVDRASTPQSPSTTASSARTGGTVLLGDSYAFGLHLPHAQTLAARMGWRNGAVGGAGPADYLAQMETYLEVWRPDTVLVLLSFDDALRTLSKDLYRLPDGAGEAVAGDSLTASRRWRVTGFRRFMESLPGYHGLQAHSYWLNGFIRFAWTRFYFERLSEPAGFGDTLHVARLHHAIFRRMDALCREQGCQFVLAHNGYTAVQTLDPHQKAMIASLSDFSAELSHPVIDCAPAILQADSEGVPLELPNDDHPGPEGIAIVARCLGDALAGAGGRAPA